jgi:hypothetical protein
MPWPTWRHALVLAVLCLAAVGVQRRWPKRFPPALEPAARELAFVAALYALWQGAHSLPLAADDGAVERARQIVDVEQWLHLPSELWFQHLALRTDVSGWFVSLYYAGVHVPALVVFLVWLFVRHRDAYPHWRMALALLTGFCLAIRFVRVAPPRFLTDLGYIDLSEVYGPSVYGPVGTGVSDQFAAMPSIHVAWAAVVSFGIVAVSSSRWRWLYLLHLGITFVVVSATGHHWWLDSIVALVLLGAALAIDNLVRKAIRWWRRPPPVPSGPAPPPATEVQEPVLL